MAENMSEPSTAHMMFIVLFAVGALWFLGAVAFKGVRQ